jgi:hypothetical protein
MTISTHYSSVPYLRSFTGRLDHNVVGVLTHTNGWQDRPDYARSAASQAADAHFRRLAVSVPVTRPEDKTDARTRR